MMRAHLVGFIFLNYLSMVHAEDIKIETPQNPVTKIAHKWVTARISRCADIPLAVSLVLEKNETVLTTLSVSADCVAENADCLKSVDTTLKDFFRMNYRRFAVRCSLNKVEINNNYLQIYSESVFGAGSSQAYQVDDSDLPKSPVADKPVREIASEKKAKR